VLTPPAVKRVVRSPLLVTHCDGCLRRRACAFVPFKAGWKHPLCRECIERIWRECGRACAELTEQGR
jgi:hypothetical protein